MSTLQKYLTNSGISYVLKDTDVIVTFDRSILYEARKDDPRVYRSKVWQDLISVHNGMLVYETVYPEIFAFSKDEMVLVELKYGDLIIKQWNKDMFMRLIRREWRRPLKMHGAAIHNLIDQFSYWANSK